ALEGGSKLLSEIPVVSLRVNIISKVEVTPAGLQSGYLVFQAKSIDRPGIEAVYITIVSVGKGQPCGHQELSQGDLIPALGLAQNGSHHIGMRPIDQRSVGA